MSRPSTRTSDSEKKIGVDASPPGAAAIGAYTGELATHAWDLATATGRRDQLDDSLAAQVLPMVRQFVPAEQRGGHVPFGPVVQVSADASPYDQLAGWQGRRP